MVRGAILAAVLVLLASATLHSQDDASATLRHRLRTLRLDVDFSNSTLAAFVDYLREVADINIVLHPKAEIPATLSMKAKGVTVASLLRLMLKPHRIGFRIEDGVLVIAPDAELRSDVRLEIIDVRDLLLPIRDFPGLEITLATDSAGATFSAAADEEPPEFPIVDLIKAHTGGKTWEENPRASIQLMNGLLFVRQTDDVILQVRKIIAGLRRFK